MFGLKSSMHEVINEAVKIAPIVIQKPTLPNLPQAAPFPVTPSTPQLTMVPAKKGVSIASPAKQSRTTLRATPSPPKEPMKKKAASAKKAPRFENVMLTLTTFLSHEKVCFYFISKYGKVCVV